MPKKMIEVNEAQSLLRELVSDVGNGTEVILTEGQKPVARILGVETSDGPRTACLHKGALRASEDFDEPLPEGFWTGSQ